MARKENPVPVRIVHEPVSTSPSYVEPDRHHVSMRQIENGWLINEHGYKDGKHFDRERFSPTPPELFDGARPAAPKRRAAPSRSRISAGPKAHAPQPRAVSSKGESVTSGFMATDFAKVPPTVDVKSPLNVPSDAPVPKLKRHTARQRLARYKL